MENESNDDINSNVRLERSLIEGRIEIFDTKVLLILARILRGVLET